jgi:hypothetical protein
MKNLLNITLGVAAVVSAIPQTQPPITLAERGINTQKLLDAVKLVESNGGKDTEPRFEYSVYRKLRRDYNILRPHIQEAIQKYGFKKLATSYGPYQVLGSTAVFLGFEGDPRELMQESVCKEWASRYVRYLISSDKTHSLTDVVSAYNAGLGGIGKNPDYTNRILECYKGGDK